MSRVVITRKPTVWQVSVMRKDLNDRLVSLKIAEEPTLIHAQGLKRLLDDILLIAAQNNESSATVL